MSANLAGIVSGADVKKDGVSKNLFECSVIRNIYGEKWTFRHYLSFSQTTVLVSRFTGGMGYAYGNSYTMPFIKEFFAGGANDIRAFRSRSLGPGILLCRKPGYSFYCRSAGKCKTGNEFGDYDLKSFLLSAGHFLWMPAISGHYDMTVHVLDPSLPSNWLNQIGVGVGTGLRLDISILLIRLDLGIPVREPWLPKGQRWVFDTKNTVLNFAIGYPF